MPHGQHMVRAAPRLCPWVCIEGPLTDSCSRHSDRRLIIPDYPTADGLKEKLLVALEHGAVGYDRM